MSDYLLALLNGSIDEQGYVKLFKQDLAARGFNAISSSRDDTEQSLAAAGWLPGAGISWSARRMQNSPPKRAACPESAVA